MELAGVAAAEPAEDRARYHAWVAAGFAAEMGYLTDHRAEVRDDPRRLLPEARSILCVGKLYQTPWPHSTRFRDTERGWISRYAWGEDYHAVMRQALEQLDARLRAEQGSGYTSRICVDTAPLLERTYARLAGLGWIGRNTCLINQQEGSWFFLGALLVSLEIAPDAPPADRCGTCMRCVEACPTEAIVPGQGVDSRLCISYLTIELRGAIPEERRSGMGAHVFGCDICQDVCPWNGRAPVTGDPAFAPQHFAPRLEELAAIGEEEFRAMFRGSAIARAKYAGFLRNVRSRWAIAARRDACRSWSGWQRARTLASQRRRSGRWRGFAAFTDYLQNAVHQFPRRHVYIGRRRNWMRRNLLSSAMLGALVLAGGAMAAGNEPAGKSDAELVKSIRHEILMYPHYTMWDDVTFRVENGSVELDGAVNQPYKRADLERIVRRVPGVAALTNELKVLPLSTFDDRLRVQIARAIFSDPTLARYAMGAVPSIHIIVENGHVTLTGAVMNAMDKQIASVRAASSMSFGPVVNHLSVDNPPVKKS